MSGTVINTNTRALNTCRVVKSVGALQTKASARLSSGLKINSGADDAAGLAISEKMRAQIRGLMKAQDNTSDGINLIQIADGGMNEIQNILIRQRELAVQALNDTLTGSDRDKIQKEISQLNEEINGMAYRTEYNTIKVLLGGATIVAGGGDLWKKLTPFFNSDNYPPTSVGVGPIVNISPANVAVQANETTKIAYVKYDTWESPYESPSFISFAAFCFDVNDLNNDMEFILSDSNGLNLTLSYADIISGTGGTAEDQDILFAFERFNNSVYLTVTLRCSGEIYKKTGSSGEAVLSIRNKGSSDTSISLDGEIFTNNDTLNGYPDAGIDFTVGFFEKETDGLRDIPKELWIQTGANSHQGIYIDLYDCRTETLGIENINLSTPASAQHALPDIDKAFGIINSYRSNAGAQNNRLEYTNNSLGVAYENAEGSNSRICDADMAKEIMNLTKANIMMQAGMLMLAQANQNSSLVLQLLR